MRTESKKFTAEELRNKKRFLSNTSVQVIGTVVNVGTGMAITAVLARYLGVEGYGKLSLALVYFTFTGIIASLGYRVILVRESAKLGSGDEDVLNELATSGLVLRFGSTLLAIVLLGLYLLGKDYSLTMKAQVLLLALCHFVTILGTFDFVFLANLRMAFSVYAAIVYRILHLGMIAACAYLGLSLTAILCTYLVGHLVNSILVFVFSQRFFSFRFRWNLQRTLLVLKESFPIGVAAGLWIIYYRVDVLMLEGLKGVESVAIYNAAFRLVDYAYIFSGILMSSIFPLMSSRYPGNPEGLNRIYQKSVDYIAIIGGIGAVLLLIFSSLAITILFGDGYGEAIPTLRILSFIPLLVCLNNLYGHMLLVLGMQGKHLILMRCVGVVVNVSLNLFLIPRYNYYGAAWATVATELALLLAVPFIISSKLKYVPSPRNMLLALTVITASFAWVVHVSNVWAASLVPIAAYALVIGLVGKCDWRELWAMVCLRPKE